MTNTTDYSLADQTGSDFRTELNNILSDIQSTNIGTGNPTTAVKGKIYIDDTNDKIKIYDGSNWIDLGASFTQDMGHAKIASPTFTGLVTAPEISISGTSRLKLPVGSSAQRPGTPVTGDTRYNSTIAAAETYTGSAWEQLGGAPIGAVFAMAHSTVPSGFLECNGAAVSRSTYSNLFDFFNAISLPYGSGNGSSTFNLPDLRGEWIRGWANTSTVDQSRGIGTSQADQNKLHNHDINDAGHDHDIGISNGDSGSEYVHESGGGRDETNSTDSVTTGITIQNSGGTEVRVRNIAMMYVIKY